MTKKLISIFTFICLWSVLALIVNNDIILPAPYAVLSRCSELLLSASFYMSLLMTFLRAHIGFIISLISGILVSYLCYIYKWLEDILSLWIKGLQTIPQISFIIFLLFWIDHEICVYVVVTLIGFPIVYFNMLESFKSIPQEYKDILQLYDYNHSSLLINVYLPLCRSTLISTIKSALPLCLKVTVMSEVLLFTSVGLGNDLSDARVNIDMIGVFAYTLLLIAAISIEMKLINKTYKTAN